MRTLIVQSLLPLTTLIVPPHHALATHEWPRWRGPAGLANWDPAPTPNLLDNAQPKLLWKIDSGQGYGGITVSEGRAYILDRLTEPEEIERIRCLNATNGEVLWQHQWPVEYGKMGGYSTGPRSSVLIHQLEGQSYAYALGATGQLFCFRTKDGTIHWQVDTVAKYEAQMPQWGFAASPVVFKNKLWVHVGSPNGTTLALDPSTGKELFRGGHDEAGYCTPELAHIHESEQIIQWGPNHIMGIDPANGHQLWSYPYKITYGVSIAQPLVIKNLVLVSGYWHGTKAIRLDSTLKPTLVWENEKDICGLMSSPLYKNGYVYLLDKTHGLTCFQLETGHILWRDDNKLTPKDRNPHFSIVWMKRELDLAALLNANGELIYVKLTPAGSEELARHQIIDKTWAHPAFVGNRIYARSDSQFVAWELWPQP